MSKPKPILPGASYLITRRCAERQFLLRPSDETNKIVQFSLAVAAARTGVQVHAFGAMSNHLHMVVTDPDAKLPRFQQLCNALIARAMNASLGHWESFWSPSSYNAVRLVTPADIVDKVAYVLANPVSAGLVRTFRLWPGAFSELDRIGGDPLRAERPGTFFARNGAFSKDATLQLTVPEGFSSPEEFRKLVAAAVTNLERAAETKFKGVFKGIGWVLKQRPFSRPSSIEPRRVLRPRIAAKDPSKRIAALAQLTEFVRAYRAAWAARRANEPDVIFPAGTYLLRVVHGVPCAGFG